MLIRVRDDVSDGECDQAESHDAAKTDKGEEISVVSSADTVVQPYTMMVLGFNAGVADSTVVGSWWTPDFASLTVLRRHFHSRGRTARSCRTLLRSVSFQIGFHLFGWECLHHDPFRRWWTHGERIALFIRVGRVRVQVPGKNGWIRECGVRKSGECDEEYVGEDDGQRR